MLNKIIDALKAGKVVTYCGHNVTLEGNYSWQVKNLWVNLNNGAAYKAGVKEVRAMIVN